jgi:hypothetical protein
VVWSDIGKATVVCSSCRRPGGDSEVSAINKEPPHSFGGDESSGQFEISEFKHGISGTEKKQVGWEYLCISFLNLVVKDDY